MDFRIILKRSIIIVVLLGLLYQFYIYATIDYENKPSEARMRGEFSRFYNILGGDLMYFDRGLDLSIYSSFEKGGYDEAFVESLVRDDGWSYLGVYRQGRLDVMKFCKGELSFQINDEGNKIFYGIHWTAQTNLPESCRSTKK